MKKTVYLDEDLKDLIPTFIENRNKELTTLPDLLTKGDFKQIAVIGHKLAGNAGGYGFDELGAIGKRLELSAKEENAQASSVEIENMKGYLTNIDIQFKKS